MMNKREFKLKFVIAASVLAAFSLILCNVSCSDHLSLLEELPPSTSSAKTYTITVSSILFGGTVSVDKNTAAAGETVKISVTPDTGYVLAALSVKDESGNEIACTENTFKMPESNVTVKASFGTAQLSFSFNSILRDNLKAGTSATKFIHSPTPPGESVTTYKLSGSYSAVDVLAWLDGTTIYFYAKGYTDSNKKIPLTSSSYGLFKDCSSLQEIEIEFFDTSEVTGMSSMFEGCSGLTTLDLSSFDTQNVTDMSWMFSGCSGLTTLVLSSSFDTSKVTDMVWMFNKCSALKTLDLSSFNTANVTDMHGMFSGCSGLTTLVLPSSFNTSNVTSMEYMFSRCSGLTTLDLSCFDTQNVTDMGSMFAQCSALITIKVGDNFVVDNVDDSSFMFWLSNSLKGGEGTTYYYSNPDDKTYARIDKGPDSDSPGYFTRGN